MLIMKEIPVVALVLLGALIPQLESASLSIYEQKKYKQLIDGQGLYGADDDVVILTVHNFKSKVYGQDHGWLIEFYNSWCGFCQRFAPSWKALASDIRGWRNMVKIGAIDCSDDDNSPICRDFEIMGYPTLRYFHERYEEGPKKLGADVVKGEDVSTHRKALIQHLAKEQTEGRGKMYPQLLPYTHTNLNHLFDDVPINTKYVFLIFENGTAFGPEVALDLKSIPQIAVKFTNDNYTQLAQTLQMKFPQMIVMSDGKKSQQFAAGLHSRESFKMAITKFLRENEMLVPEQVSQTPEDIFTGKWYDAEVPDMDSLLRAREWKTLLVRAKAMGDVVFQMDLESAVRNALKNEVGRVKTILGEKREALINFLTVLVKYFPFGSNGNRFLIELKDNVATSATVSGKQVKDFVENAERGGQVFSSPAQWLGCEGSIAGHRGYPCGLWKLFHYLTINAVERGSGRPREVLDAMHGYIKNFFGCADCSEHFQDMAKRRNMGEVTTLDESIVWLWGAHNEVNKRLAGDQTEDPEFPKIQFPMQERCPSCRQDQGAWDFNEVLKYLKNMYHSNNVRYLGVDTKVIHSGLGNVFSATSGSLGFMRGLDASMCFILYVSSFLLLVVLIRLFLKRGYRKKMYVHDLLGKV